MNDDRDPQELGKRLLRMKDNRPHWPLSKVHDLLELEQALDSIQGDWQLEFPFVPVTNGNGASSN